MKKLLISLVMCLCLPAVNATEASDADVKNFFEVMKIKKNYQIGLDNMLEAQKRSVPDFHLFESTFKDWMNQYLAWEAVEAEMLDLYCSYFTKEDLQELTRFYETAVGRKYVEKSPFIARESVRIGSQAAQRSRHHLEEMIKYKLERIKKEANK